jgi:hypothetical protein
MVPFMKRLHRIAFLPYHVYKLMDNERKHINTFAGLRSYELRREFHYVIMKGYKPGK